MRACLTALRLVAVGASSPIPAAGAMLLRARNVRGLTPVRIIILGSREHNFFTNGGVELFDWPPRAGSTPSFLGGGQIDGQANINLVGTGDYPHSDVRWPGSFGSAFLYFFVPRVILFREETFAARVGRESRFHQRARHQRRLDAQRRSLCAADGARAV